MARVYPLIEGDICAEFTSTLKEATVREHPSQSVYFIIVQNEGCWGRAIRGTGLFHINSTVILLFIIRTRVTV